MLDRLLTEQVNPASSGIDSLPTEDMLRVINDADEQVARAVRAEISNIARGVDAIVERLRGSGRLFYLGAGTSGRLGVLDAAECAPTFQVSRDMVQGIIAGGASALEHAAEASEDDPVAGARDLILRGVGSRDVLVGIAASGRTPYVLGGVAKARELGAVTIGISCAPGSELSQAVDIPITPLPGPEVLAGSTRMRAGTATKLVLNMLSTGAMIRLGHVYGNLMVNVQPTNRKLEDRARRIIAQATGVSFEEASDLLGAAGRVVKVAILMSKAGLGRAEAEQRLASAGGQIRTALNAELVP